MFLLDDSGYIVCSEIISADYLHYTVGKTYEYNRYSTDSDVYQYCVEILNDENTLETFWIPYIGPFRSKLFRMFDNVQERRDKKITEIIND